MSNYQKNQLELLKQSMRDLGIDFIVKHRQGALMTVNILVGESNDKSG